MDSDFDSADRVLHAAQKLISDRKTILTLRSLRERLAAGQPDGLDDDFFRLQNADAFTMVPMTAGGTTFVPLYRAIFDLFHSFPKADAQRLIDSLSSVADRSLQTAISDRSITDLPRLIHRFPGTNASFEAHLVIAKLHLLRGNQLAARGWLTALTRPQIDHPARHAAEQILQTIDQHDRTLRSARHQASARTDQRSDRPLGQLVDSAPRHFAWQYRPFVSPVLKKQITAFQNACWHSAFSPQTTWNTVVNENALFRKTLRGVAAIDPATGDARWHSGQLPNVDAEITESSSNSTAFRGLSFDVNAFPKLDGSLLATTFCRDSVVGRLSADDERIYFVAEEPHRRPVAQVNNLFLRRLTTSSFSSTKLVALEKVSGRRVWTAGSSSLAEHFGPGRAGSWFAGPPLVAGRHLLNTFEWNGEVHLGCFASNTGELLWSTVMAVPDQTIDKDAVRRQWSGTPERHGGLIWVPTTTGNICCVDELARSVLWSTSVERDDPQNQASSLAGRRGRSAIFTRPASLHDRWADSELFFAGRPADAEGPRTETAPDRNDSQEPTVRDRLVVFSERSRDIVFVDAKTGTIDRRLSAAPGTVRVHIDSGHIVLAENNSLRCLTSANGYELWNRPLTSIGGRPTGRGVLQTSLLRIPVSNGSIATLEMETGDIVDRTPSILPTRGWGHLQATGTAHSDDLLYVAPDRVMKLSRQPAAADADNTLERALGLMSSERWMEAIQLTEDIVETDPDFRAAQEVSFQCALQLCLVNPKEFLPKLQALANTEEQEIHVRVLQVALQLKDKQYRVAADRLTEILRLSPSTLTMPTPQIRRQADASAEANTKNGHPTAIRSLHTWATSEFSRLLEISPDALAALTEGEAVSVAVMLSIHHPSIRGVLHQHIRDAGSDETAIQLLCHSIHLAKQTPAAPDSDPFSAERSLLNTWMTVRKKRPPQQDATLRAAQELLLSTLMPELSEGFMDAETSVLFRDTDDLDEQFRAAITSRCAEWKAQPFEAIPVTQTQTFIRNRTVLSTVELDDPFLRRYEWAATSGDFGRLQARDVLSTGNEQWSVPGRLQVYGAYSNRSDLLHRMGSILLLQTYREIVAISVLDQKILWRRSLTSTSGVQLPFAGNFRHYDADRNPLPSQTAYSSFRIVGSGDRWLCILHGQEIEMLDTFTGSVLWSVKLPTSNSYARVKATDTVVIAGPAGHSDAFCFDRQSGEKIKIKDAADLAARTICNTGDLLVCWTTIDSQAGASLQWIDPVTGSVKSEVSLADFQWFQFLDDRTLCGFNDKFEMFVVNLKTRKQQKCSFHVAADTSQEDSRAKNGKTTEALPPETPLWDSRNMQVAADSLNFYVSNRVGLAAGPFRQPSGHKFTRFRSGLRAVSRHDGSLRWSIRDDRVLLASTDQPGLPILVLVNDSPLVAKPSARNMFRAFSKLSGDELFKQSVPSKQGLRYTWLDSSAPNSLDIAVHGMRVRVRSTPANTVVP
ncbi:MAG: PQQ-binding-like beta-propeller repeat protein [Fuerstiella sp.]|nr:PQQ-binding-like beta-propeller repeat protein [Fuerstiella sp.]